MQKNNISELYTNQLFVAHLPNFAEHHSRTAAKYETAIHNSVKCGLSFEKIQLILDLFTKIFFNINAKQSIFFYVMNPILVLYHRKIEHKLYTANWQKQFETKMKQTVFPALVQAEVSTLLKMKGYAVF